MTTLLDVLKLIGDDLFPPKIKVVQERDWYSIDAYPQTTVEVTLCFSADKETWITCNIQSEVLIPWYDCEVFGINAENSEILVWLSSDKYIYKNYKHCLKCTDMENKCEEGDK